MEKEFFLFLVIGIILISGCTQQNLNPSVSMQEAKQKCIQLCQEMKDKVNLSQGPCLSDIAYWNVSGWVCDVAHKPREPIDNKRENQCDDWHSGKAKNFVEVTPQCDFIRIG